MRFYAVLLQLIGRHDAALAKTLHDSQGPKPFTTSPLQGPQTPRGHEVRLQENGAYWLRVTSIDPYLSDILATLESTPPSHMTLHQGRFDVLQVSSQPQDHPWAARSSYEQLYSDAQRRQGGGRPHVTMRFESATAFHSQGRTHVLPLPRLVFGSLLNRWNAYAPVELHEDLAEEFDLGLDIEQHELKTVIQNFRRYQLQVGLCGFLSLPRAPGRAAGSDFRHAPAGWLCPVFRGGLPHHHGHGPGSPGGAGPREMKRCNGLQALSALD